MLAQLSESDTRLFLQRSGLLPFDVPIEGRVIQTVPAVMCGFRHSTGEFIAMVFEPYEYGDAQRAAAIISG